MDRLSGATVNFRRIARVCFMAIGLGLFIFISAKGLSRIDDMSVVTGQKAENVSAVMNQLDTTQLPVTKSAETVAQKPIEKTEVISKQQSPQAAQDKPAANPASNKPGSKVIMRHVYAFDSAKKPLPLNPHRL